MNEKSVNLQYAITTTTTTPKKTTPISAATTTNTTTATTNGISAKLFNRCRSVLKGG